jgi:hypothetical protein
MIIPKYDQPRKPTKAEEKAAYETVSLRDGGVCVKCRRTDPVFGVSRDHRKERSRGGLTTPAGLQLLCGGGTTGCHGWKTQNPHAALIEGYAVPSWADAADYPARRWLPTGIGMLRRGWVLYDDEGNWIEISDLEADVRMKGGSDAYR